MTIVTINIFDSRYGAPHCLHIVKRFLAKAALLYDVEQLREQKLFGFTVSLTFLKTCATSQILTSMGCSLFALILKLN